MKEQLYGSYNEDGASHLSNYVELHDIKNIKKYSREWMLGGDGETSARQLALARLYFGYAAACTTLQICSSWGQKLGLPKRILHHVEPCF